jgi:transposase
LSDSLGAVRDLKSVYRRLLKMALDQLELLDLQIGQLDQQMAGLITQHQDAVQRLTEIPGLGVDAAQQIVAEIGPTAATFPSAKSLSSWVGARPGEEESAGVNHSHRSPKGNRQMRRILTFRHTYKQVLEDNHVNPAVIHRLMRHSSYKITERYGSGMMMDLLREGQTTVVGAMRPQPVAVVRKRKWA